MQQDARRKTQDETAVVAGEDEVREKGRREGEKVERILSLSTNPADKEVVFYAASHLVHNVSSSNLARMNTDSAKGPGRRRYLGRSRVHAGLTGVDSCILRDRVCKRVYDSC